MATDPNRIAALRSIASDISWARTPNRSERTEPARRASPGRLESWIAKIRAEGVVREQDVEAAAANALRAHMRGLALKSAASRRSNADLQRRPALRRSA